MQPPEYLAQTLRRLQLHYDSLSSFVVVPKRVRIGGNTYFRHVEQSDVLFCYLKGVKLISTLNAGLVLLQAGYTQEIGALCRMADDFCYEILFFMGPFGPSGPSKDQIRMLEDFFKEEFENPADVLGSAQNRDTVPRRKINAAFGKLAQDQLNPHDAQGTLETVHKAFSGYVHGAYPHIMELYGGSPPRYHLDGMLGTPRIAEWQDQLVTYVYRVIMVAELTSKRLGANATEQAIRQLLVEYETTLNCKPTESAVTRIRHKLLESRLSHGWISTKSIT